MRTIAFILTGLASGIFSGGLGVGGASVATPLVRFLGLGPYQAVGSTVPMILPGSLTGAWTYLRAGLVDKRAVLWTALSAGVFAFAGARATRLINGHLLMLGVAAVLFVLALRLLPDHNPESEPRPPVRSRSGFAIVGAVAGFCSGLLGVGGGFVMVPVFIRWFRLPTKVALGTSLCVIALTVVPNVLGQTIAGNVAWKAALLLCIGVVPGARIGAVAAISASDKMLRRIMALALCVTAIGYAAFEIWGLFSNS
jgi:uncharacterized protein